MSIYIITNFDEGPHGEHAVVEADSPEEAKLVLNAYFQGKGEDYLNDNLSVWDVKPMEEWSVSLREGLVHCCLGAGCR